MDEGKQNHRDDAQWKLGQEIERRKQSERVSSYLITALLLTILLGALVGIYGVMAAWFIAWPISGFWLRRQ